MIMSTLQAGDFRVGRRHRVGLQPSGRKWRRGISRMTWCLAAVPACSSQLGAGNTIGPLGRLGVGSGGEIQCLKEERLLRIHLSGTRSGWYVAISAVARQNLRSLPLRVCCWAPCSCLSCYVFPGSTHMPHVSLAVRH